MLNHSVMPEILKPRDVAEIFGVDTKTVARWAKTGRLTSFRTAGRHRRFYKKDVEALLNAEYREAT